MEWQCEMRAATVLRRSGWSAEMFKAGEPIKIEGAPDRFDVNSCYVHTVVFADGTTAKTAACAAVLAAGSAGAHHGFGNFDRSQEVTLEGTITSIDFVNPHAYVYFEATNPDGTKVAKRCEMRTAKSIPPSIRLTRRSLNSRSIVTSG